MTRPQKRHEPLPYSFDQTLEGIADENKPTTQSVAARPFLKWVGGKRSVLPQLLERLPKNYGVYHEPFLGGGALYFAVQPEKAYLSDVNFHLIITFQIVRDSVDVLIHNLKIHAAKHSKEYYLQARKRLFTEKDSAKIAALFIYLNKTCFNGLYRVNKSGMFNVPIGDYKNPPILDEENLRNASKLMRNTIIVQHEFSQTPIHSGDFYYFDPPYHETFNGYNDNGFGEDKHRELAEFCKKIDKKGGYFMLSNSDTDFVQNLYKGYNVENISASRSVSCKAHQRGKENELLIRNYKS